jgi:hypothetical protein
MAVAVAMSAIGLYKCNVAAEARAHAHEAAAPAGARFCDSVRTSRPEEVEWIALINE